MKKLLFAISFVLSTTSTLCYGITIKFVPHEFAGFVYTLAQHRTLNYPLDDVTFKHYTFQQPEADLYVRRSNFANPTELLYQLSHLKSIKDIQQILTHIQNTSARENILKLVNEAYVDYAKKKSVKIKTKKHADSANKLIKDHQKLINDFVAAISHFYNTPKFPYNEMIVYIFPAEKPAWPVSFYNTILLPVSDQSNIQEDLGLVMSEISHMYYQNQDVALQRSIEKFFFQSSSPYAYTTYCYLNDAMPIVLGQGIFMEKLLEQSSEVTEHDTQDYLLGLVQALHDELKTSLQHKATINEEFLQKAIERFAVACPDAPRDIQEVLTRYIVLTKHFELAEVIGRIYSFFPSGNIFGSPIDDKEEMEQDMQSSGYNNYAPIVCVLTPQEVENIETFVHSNPYLQRVPLDQLKAVPPILKSVYAFLDAKGRAYMFFIVDELNQLETLLKALSKVDYLPKEHPFGIRPNPQEDSN